MRNLPKNSSCDLGNYMGWLPLKFTHNQREKNMPRTCEPSKNTLPPLNKKPLPQLSNADRKSIGLPPRGNSIWGSWNNLWSKASSNKDNGLNLPPAPKYVGGCENGQCPRPKK